MSERRIPISTPVGQFEVWTRTTGNNPKARLLLLHGGPGASAEYFESLAASLVAAGIEVIEYDQLGSYRSDQPTDTSLWDLDRFVDEVEQVRIACNYQSGTIAGVRVISVLRDSVSPDSRDDQLGLDMQSIDFMVTHYET